MAMSRSQLRKLPARTCSIPGCGNEHVALGLCNMHYRRQRYGTPMDGPRPRSISRYDAAHDRLRRVNGPARTHLCAHCGEPAVDWAYDHADPDEKVDGNGRRPRTFSVDPAHYRALCKKCHRRFDLTHK